MTKNKIAKYIANTALLAVIAAAGIGAYQLGTSRPGQEIQDPVEMETEEEFMVDAGTDQVEAEMENTIENNSAQREEEVIEKPEEETDSAENTQEQTAPYQEAQENTGAEQDEEENTETAAGAVSAPSLSFSEETQMEWPVNGNILLDYNMDQTIYFPTLDQYKLSPAIAVQAVEGAPVLASVPGTVYSIEENAQTGTTVTMELGSGYQAVYGQLKDLAVEEGQTVEKGDVIGYIAAPTKYYSEEGSNLYFAMKKDGEPVDPIAYLPE